MDDKNVQFMLDSLKILLECGETEHAIALIDAYTEELKAEQAEDSSTENAKQKTAPVSELPRQVLLCFIFSYPAQWISPEMFPAVFSVSG